MRTILEAAQALESGATTARTLVEDSLARIADPAGEGARAFVKVHAEQARASADAMDALRRAGRAPSRFAGIPISLKDLFDIEGEPTPAGSRVLADATPAASHAPIVARLIGAGFIPVGRTNMVEFAFSGLGLNPHFGTPRAPWDRGATAEAGRIPGGSSSGAAVSVADGMAFGAIGTDTGGSCRIPAAFCGIAGYKPTARRVPIAGVLPLSPSLDSVGPLANSVACCAILDAVMAGEAAEPPRVAELAGLRLALPESLLAEGVAPEVAACFARAVAVLEAAGARIARIAVPEFAEIFQATAMGGLTAAEAYAWHRGLLAARGGEYDPNIRFRIERGASIGAADYLDVLATRRRLIAGFDARTAPFDAMILPTSPILPERIAALSEPRDYNRVNLLSLRHTTLANFLDRCSISIPCHRPGEGPVGLMLFGETMGDARLFAIAAAAEAALRA
ncbi:MAG: amidase [Rhodospirillales bacterium]|nr:amidase [Rhodospirillales bacterium]